MLKKFLMTMAILAGVFLVNALTRSVVYGLCSLGKPVFLFTAVTICLLAFVVEDAGSIIFAINKHRS